MVVKLVKGKRELIYPCEHAETEPYDDRVDIELHYLPPRKPRVVSLPRDGDVAYVEDGGKTVSVKRWPVNGNSRDDTEKNKNDKADRVDAGRTVDLSDNPTFRG